MKSSPHPPARPSPGAQLRELLASGQFVQAPGVYDAFSAALVERAGLPAAYVSGGSASVAVTGLPDLGLMTGSEMADHVGRLRGICSLPLIVDIDTGYGNELNVRHTVERMHRVGAAAVHIEDQQAPKRCGHLEGKAVVPVADAVARVKAAVAAARGTDLLVIARTDVLAVEGRTAAIDRAHAFVDAGAEMIFIEAPESVDDLEVIGSSIDAPLMVNVLANSRTPLLSAHEYQELGFAVAIYPSMLLAAAATAASEALGHLVTRGVPPGEVASPREIFEIVGLSQWLRWPTEIGIAPNSSRT